MEEFLPSEIARAVYGYLLSVGCNEAASIFLDTSPNLTECKQRVNTGKPLTHANTLLLGRNLTEVLNIACSVHSLVKQAQEKRQQNKDHSVGETSFSLLEQLRSFVLREGNENLSLQESNVQEQQPNSDQAHQVSEVNNGKETTPKKIQHLQTNAEQTFSPPLTLDSLVLQDDRSQLCTQSDVPHTEPSPQHLNTPKRCNLQKEEVSLAENYKNLVQECSEGLDLSSSPDKSHSKNRNGGCRTPVNQPISAPLVPELEVENQSAIAAIAGIAFRSSQASQVLVTSNPPQMAPLCTSLPTNTNVNLLSEPVVTPASTGVTPQTYPLTSTYPQQVYSAQPIVISTNCNMVSSVTPSFSAPQPIMSTASTSFLYPNAQPMVLTNPSVDGIDKLPDPPIIMLNSQYEPIAPLDANTSSASYFGGPPCAASTPHTNMFAPEDTACIIYPLISTTLPRKRKKVKEKPQRLAHLRKLLPKPPRKDPPNIIHIKVLPQNIDEEDEDEEANDSKNDLENDKNEMELAKELPELGEEHTEIEKEITVKEDVLQLRGKDDNSIINDEKMCKDNNTDKEKFMEEEGNDKETQVNTPKPNALKKNISRSTPRRNSHIRALSFNTPLKPTVNRKSNTSPKMPKIRFSPRTNKLNNVKRSSLFKSPTSPKSLKDLSCLAEEDESESHEDEEGTKNNENLTGKSSKIQTSGRSLTSKQKTTKQSYLHLENEEAEKENSGDFFEKSSLTKIPIATRSPAPKLSNAWKEVNDITITEKPQWDEKIRSFISGDFVDPAPPPKMKTKRKNKEKTPSHEKISKEVSVQKNKGERRSLRLTKKNEKPLKNYSTKTNCTSVMEDTPKKVILASSLQSIKKNNHNRRKALKKPHSVSQQSVSSKEISSSSDGSFSNLNQTGSSSNRNDNKNLDIDSSKTKNEVLRKCNDVNEKEPTTEDNVLTTTNNILLEDLVVSSNSCFPLIGDDVGSERDKLSKEISRRSNENSVEKQTPISNNHKILESDETTSLKTSSPEFALPHVSTLETPLKEFQIITPQACLNTPMLNIIRQDVSVLEEDLLLTPSLPPTPQVNSFKHPVKTPCKSKMSPHSHPMYNEDKTRYVEQSLHSESDIKSAKSPTTINENKTQSSCKQIHSESISNEPQTTHENNSKADLVISKKLEQENITTIEKPKNELISTSTDSSEDDIVNNYVAKLKNNKSNVTVQSKLANKSKIDTPSSKANIYTSSESSNDGVDYTMKNNQTKSNMSVLSNMLLQNERKKLDGKTKLPGCNKKQKKMLKKTSQSISRSSNSLESSSNKQIEKSTRKKSKSIDKNSISEENKEQNSAKYSMKNHSPKISLSVDKFEKSLTPEKVRQQLQLDLLKRERQMIFGDGVSFSSDSDTETEVFERKTIVAKKTKSKKSEKLKRKSTQEVNSDISSNVFSAKDQEKEKFDKGSKFENSQQNEATEDSIELNKDESAVAEISVMIEASSEKIQHELVEDNNKEVLRAVESIALISPCQSSQSTVIKYTERTAYTGISDSSCSINENNSKDIEHFKVQEHLANNIGSKDVITSVIKEKSPEENCNTKGEDIHANLSDSLVKNNDVHENEINRESEEKDNISEKDLPRPPTPYRINPDNIRNVPNPMSQSQFSESSEVEENHIFFVSSTTCTKINTSFCTSEFDPSMKCGFEVDDNKVITASFSEMILHLALPSKTCTNIKKPSQEKKPLGGDIPKHPPKRRVKLTPVCDDKYEQKLKVDYDIDEEGHIINKKGERRIVSDLDVLDVSCSTIETNISLGENNTSVHSSFELITSKQQVKDSNVQENEPKLNVTKNTTERPQTYKNENKTCLFSDVKKCAIDNNTTERKHEQYLRRERNQHYTCRYDSKMISSSESTGRPKEGSHRKETDQISLNDSVSSEDKRDKYIHRTHLDRRKERESSHRRRDSFHRRRSSEEIKQNKNYFERRRYRDYDRKVYSERRYYTSTRRQRRGESSSPVSRRRGFKQHTSETSLARCYSNRTPRSPTDKNALFVKKLNVHYEDVDNVEKVGNRSGKDESLLKPTVKVDPRSAQVITYSDLEKNESSSDGAPSLMDFAVMHKTKDNRSATVSLHSSQQLNVDSDKVDSSLSHKRKALDDGKSGLETPQAHKKLKLGEVEMKEAKSVLKHKMADMLNVLHPDTSNEAS